MANCMMRRKFAYVVIMTAMIFIAGTGEICAQGLDSLKKVELVQRLEEYFEALKYEDIEVQKAECDFLIETSSDPSIRSYIAQTIYDHYMDSKIMGAEAVAIHVIDRWFIPGKVSFDDVSELFAAQIFAEFNRMSQIGMKAPEISMESIEGQRLTLFGGDDRQSRFRVLYFYDADCAKCRMESILLSNTLAVEDFPIELVAIYTGDDREEWEEYVSDRLTWEGGGAEVMHLWDPAIESDFQRKYGILQTPRMLLVRPDGVISGRGLDTQTLSYLLQGIFDEVALEYGGDESVALFDGIFSSYPTKDEVETIAGYISDSTLPKGDTVMFRQLTGDLLYYLATHSGEGFREGMGFLIEENIYGMPQVWKSSDDSLKVIGFARIMDDLLSKSRPGTRIADIRMQGDLHTWNRSKEISRNLRSLKGENNIIMFVTEGCAICSAEKKAALELVSSDRKMKLFIVNVDEITGSNPLLASELFDSFDLSTLPFIIQTDRKGMIKRRYMSLQ